MSRSIRQPRPTLLGLIAPRASPRLIASAAIGATAVALGACGGLPKAGPDGLYAKPIGNAPVTANPTPYTPALK